MRSIVQSQPEMLDSNTGRVLQVVPSPEGVSRRAPVHPNREVGEADSSLIPLPSSL
jgi:hypothetical protein